MRRAARGEPLEGALFRWIARAHGGTVTLTARDGGGSCFTLRLPKEAVEEGYE
ncbi:MAG TPA: hypothetical protein VFZ09_05035 [Archangium sp.]|uniref:hypothetical protein n=1 Tax=Archangium sp. TaxID=1872627 RepID=UPI002E339915|nr:hypothetical protein [Archangium sp.]HEX5745587.1 hypothetical protein [Archangium sp.]